ncbi:MAG: hypothetical protein KDC53_08620 [Saprospiraceae bacterium]|nr:hypothetical protein [Saprospiraceae bacterium]
MRSILVISFLFFLTSSTAQQSIFETYSIQDGLVANQIRKITQDTEGFIWIATWEGLSKYNGHKFTNYSSSTGLTFDLINDLYIDDDQTIYVAENNHHIDVIVDNQLSTPLTDSITVNKFIKSGSATYAITDDLGILIFKNKKFYSEHHQTFKSVQDFAKINDSLFIILDSDFNAVILDKNFQVFATDKTQQVYQSISVDRENNIWLCGHNILRLLNRVQKKNSTVAFYPLPESFQSHLLKDKDIYQLFEDVDGNYWLSTLQGLIRISSPGSSQIFTTRNGLPTNLVTGLFQDREKNIWSCSQLGLVKLVMKNDFKFIMHEDGTFIENVSHLTIGEFDDVYFNNSTNIFKMGATDITCKPFGPVGVYQSIEKDPGKPAILAIANAGILVIPEQNEHALQLVSTIERNYTQAEVDSRNNIFLSSFNGIFVKPPDGSITHLALDQRITCMNLDHEGFLWAGTWESGLFRIKLDYSSSTIETEISEFSKVINNLHIRSFFIDNNRNYWIGTRYNGVIRLNQNNNGAWSILQYDKTNGLSSNWVSCFAQDENENIWVGTHNGLNKLIPEPDGYRIFNFSRLNNFFGELYSIVASKNDYLWFGGFSGLVRFHDDKVDTLTVPRVSISSATAGNQDLDIKTGPPLLNYKLGSITFEFSVPSFLNEKAILYSYRLLGATDTRWSIPKNLHNISYSGLEPGRYQFAVKAYGLNNLPGDAANFDFIISPPYWKTWWFYSIIIFVLFLILLSIYQYRINQMLKWQKARDKIATDLHDDIGSSLTNINILSELSQRHLDQPQTVENFLIRIKEEVQGSAQAMDDIIWSVNSQNDSLEETLARMRRYTSELFDGSNIKYHLHIDEKFKSRTLNMEQRRDIFLMYKEILNNICRHADAQEVYIEVHLITSVLRLSIKDNGKGFLRTNNSHGNGLRNIEQRTRKWKGTISIDSKFNHGTAIEITLPLKE